MPPKAPNPKAPNPEANNPLYAKNAQGNTQLFSLVKKALERILPENVEEIDRNGIPNDYSQIQNDEFNRLYIRISLIVETILTNSPAKKLGGANFQFLRQKYDALLHTIAELSSELHANASGCLEPTTDYVKQRPFDLFLELCRNAPFQFQDNAIPINFLFVTPGNTVDYQQDHRIFIVIGGSLRPLVMPGRGWSQLTQQEIRESISPNTIIYHPYYSTLEREFYFGKEVGLVFGEGAVGWNVFLLKTNMSAVSSFDTKDMNELQTNLHNFVYKVVIPGLKAELALSDKKHEALLLKQLDREIETMCSSGKLPTGMAISINEHLQKQFQLPHEIVAELNQQIKTNSSVDSATQDAKQEYTKFKEYVNKTFDKNLKKFRSLLVETLGQTQATQFEMWLKLNKYAPDETVLKKKIAECFVTRIDSRTELVDDIQQPALKNTLKICLLHKITTEGVYELSAAEIASLKTTTLKKSDGTTSNLYQDRIEPFLAKFPKPAPKNTAQQVDDTKKTNADNDKKPKKHKAKKKKKDKDKNKDNRALSASGDVAEKPLAETEGASVASAAASVNPELENIKKRLRIINDVFIQVDNMGKYFNASDQVDQYTAFIKLVCPGVNGH